MIMGEINMLHLISSENSSIYRNSIDNMHYIVTYADLVFVHLTALGDCTVSSETIRRAKCNPNQGTLNEPLISGTAGIYEV
jgi:UDP-N-acetylglucosamine pyrophosphorylase